MSSLTLATLRQRVAYGLGSAYKSGTTTSAGGASGVNLISTELSDLKDQAIKNWYVKTTSGATQETRKIEHFIANEGIVKPYRAFSLQIATAVTFEIYNYEPTLIDYWINETIRASYPELKKPIIDDTLISGNILPNNSAEDWTVSTVPDYYTVDTLTCAVNTTASNRFSGASAMAVSGAAGKVYITSHDYKDLLYLESGTYTFYSYAKTNKASCLYLQVYMKDRAGTETTYPETVTYHTGGNEIELLSCAFTVPDDLEEIQFRFVKATADTGYFDHWWVDGSGWNRFPLPLAIDDVHQVRECNDAAEPYLYDNINQLPFEIQDVNGTLYLRLLDLMQDSIAGGKRLRLIASGRQTALTADTSTIYLPRQWAQAIVAGTVANLIYSVGLASSSGNYETLIKKAQVCMQLYEKLKYDNAMSIAEVADWRAL